MGNPKDNYLAVLKGILKAEMMDAPKVAEKEHRTDCMKVVRLESSLAGQMVVRKDDVMVAMMGRNVVAWLVAS